MPLVDKNARRKYNVEYHARTYAANKDKIRAQKKKWAEANREKASAYTAKWRAANPARYKESSERSAEKWRAANPEKYASMVKSIQLKSRYGTTQLQVDALFEKQRGLCGICNKPLPLKGSGRHLDHDHVTAKLRGFLCRTCNLGLGHFQDSLELLMSALRYLQNPPAGIL